ncbi:protein FAM110C [Ornithorhynchus anatinus]|uniref:Family with sequence similarity 110 member C n=1 Tax=Ornithorhynchus anatinus TaxID=9258 RepID=A0A6I8NBB3_ORNAN|nr:protein FAM110C [Ornithorhynchus anatinus]
MPTEIAWAVRMQAVSDFHSSVTTRLLNKGPDYLRRQMEGSGPARMSAVERLAADKAKYVKSQRVIDAKQEATLLVSSSESSSESCSWESGKSHRDPRGKPDPERGHLGPSPPAKGCPIARRALTRRPMRPDSLVIYRQKCEFVKGQGAESPRGSLVKRLLQGSVKERPPPSPEMPKVREETKSEGEDAGSAGPTAGGRSDPVAGPPCPPGPARPSPQPGEKEGPSPPAQGPADLGDGRRRGLHRSHSDISSRFSKSFSESDTFFKYCGLEPDVVEDLGRENFSAVSDHVSFKIRSVSMVASDGGFSHNSAGDGLLEEELAEQVSPGPSVIERNARIIKWLYTCKKAKANPPRPLQELA